MELLHEELRRAREKAGLSQQALAVRAGIPRNQVVRAERGDNITVDTLRKIVAFLPVTELTLLDTKGFRIDAIPEPEKLLFGALENVMRLSEALGAALRLAMDAHAAVEAAHRAASPDAERPAGIDTILILRELERIVGEVAAVGKDATKAS